MLWSWARSRPVRPDDKPAGVEGGVSTGGVCSVTSGLQVGTWLCSLPLGPSPPSAALCWAWGAEGTPPEVRAAGREEGQDRAGGPSLSRSWTLLHDVSIITTAGHSSMGRCI